MSTSLSTILRTKLFAVILGTYGVGLISVLLNFNSLVLVVISLGIPLGLTKFVSRWESEGNWKSIKDTVGRLTMLMIVISVPLSVLTILFAKQISLLILDSEDFAFFIIITSIAFPFSAISTIFDAYIRGLKIFTDYAKISILNSIISLLISIPCILLWGLNGAAIFFLLSAVITSFILIYFLKKRKFFELQNCFINLFYVPESIKLIFKIGIVSLIDLALHQGNAFLIRTSIVHHLGIDENGVYQSIYAISNNYLSLFSISLWVYFLPVLSEMKDIKDINNEINSAIRFTLLIIFPIISLTFVMREFVIVVLYSSQFALASDYLVYNFIGDYIRALAWVLGSWFIPRSKLWLWLSLGIYFNITYFLIFFILINYIFMDLKSVVIAYAFANLVHFVLTLHFSRKINNFRINPDIFRHIIITSICMALILIISSIDIILGYGVIIPVFVIWLKLCVKKAEVIKLLELIRFHKLIKMIK